MAADGNSSFLSSFLKLSQTWLNEQIGQVEQELVTKEKKVRELGMEITSLWREIVSLRQRLKGLRQAHENLDQHYGSELDRIRGLSGIKSIDVGPGFITVCTDTIYVNFQDKRYRIGDFRLEIYLSGYFRMNNINNPGRYAYYDHPHIRDGEPCVGNHTEALSKLIAEGQLSTVVAILLSYLQSYNPEDAYCEITCWPEIPNPA